MQDLTARSAQGVSLRGSGWDNQIALLMAAMGDETPACHGLEVFTRDRFDDLEQTEMMRGICRGYPLLGLCAAFAAAGKPRASMRAGMMPAVIRRASGTTATLAA